MWAFDGKKDVGVDARRVGHVPKISLRKPPRPTSAANMASTTISPLKALTKLRCSIFQTAYNPTSSRSGAKYLRARLRGPSMVKYYPQPDEHSVEGLNRLYPGFNLVDVDEVIRLNDVEDKKKRGKGAPKKAKSKGARYLLVVLTVIYITYFAEESRRTARKR